MRSSESAEEVVVTLMWVCVCVSFFSATILLVLHFPLLHQLVSHQTKSLPRYPIGDSHIPLRMTKV